MDAVPSYVPVIFVLTTLATLGFINYTLKSATHERSIGAIALLVLMPVWLFVQGVLARGGFFASSVTFPPRLFLFSILPALLLIAAYFVFFRKTVIERLPLRTLTLLNVVRIPVEFTLLWLALAGQEPFMMTFEGRNFDILSGILAVVVYFAAFRRDSIRRGMLIGYNLLGLALLANVVIIAMLSTPSPMQLLNLDHPNIGVLHFPYIWLPSLIVPVVLFAHLASLWQLLTGKGVERTVLVNSL